MTGGTAKTSFKRLWWIALTAGLVLIWVSRWMSLPKTPWEYDELLFTQAVEKFDPVAHHPHPPGYPLLVGLGKAVNVIAGDPFKSLIYLSFVTNLLGFAGLFFAYRDIGVQRYSVDSDELDQTLQIRRVIVALTGALLFFFSPAMLVHSSLALSDPPALMFVILTLWAITAKALKNGIWGGVLLGAFSSAAIGCRPQYAVAVLPLLVIGICFLPDLRRRALAIGVFTAVSLAWFIPLVTSLGGIAGFMAYQTKQAAFLAGQDAGLARATRTISEVVLRFVAHPWGTKWLSLPVLGLAAIGGLRAIRSKDRVLLPVGVLGVVHLTFCLAFFDPADGVRYALPVLLLIAVLASQAMVWLAGWVKLPEWVVVVAALAFCVGSTAYVWPITSTRANTASPPVQAADFLQRQRENLVVLFEPPLLPHAQWLLRNSTVRPVADDWKVVAENPDGRLTLFADRRSDKPGAQVFEWPDCDAYGKLTRNHYRVVSIVPIRSEEIFQPLQGFYPLESYIDGSSWRWLGQEAKLEVIGACARLRLTFELDKHAPYQANSVTLQIGDQAATNHEFERGSAKTIEIPCSAGNSHRLSIRSAKSYIPKETGMGLDPRRLAIKLFACERVSQ